MEYKHEKNEKIMGTRKWIFWFSLGTTLIIIYKFFDNFTGIGKWLEDLFTILTPFIAAILIAYVLYKPCSKVEKILKKRKIRHTRGLSILIVYLLVFIIVFLLLKFIAPIIINSIMDLINNIQNYYNSVAADELDNSWAPVFQENVLKPLVEYIKQLDFKTLITPERIMEYISSALGVVKTLFSAFIAIICSAYILAGRENIVKSIDKFANATMSPSAYKTFNRYFTDGNKIFFGFITSQFIDGVVVAILMSITLLILRVKYAVLLGVIIGIFNLIPYFGAIVAVLISSLITILTGGWQKALIMAIIITIVQQIDANIINPRITGTKLNISPLLIIFAVTIGGAYFGTLGMFLAVPVAVIIKLVIADYVLNKNKE